MAKKARRFNYRRPRRNLSSAARGYGYDWRQARAIKLRSDPVCEDCIDEHDAGEPTGPLETAAEVHHIQKIATHPHLRLVQENLRSLCKRHHSIRTARGE